ncbi:MAG: hypothetical protein Ct9H300mP6_10310 [Gammaproteobacteria bacterium]|nr:MAG: hypothetical protein Ct9H300mP6_10310 [Gammaproteobacteria bacterium]
MSKDSDLIEINPLILDEKNHLIALDSKMSIDSNALFRQEDLSLMKDPNQEDKLEVKASENDLSYVSLDGEIACMVNGAGLAMATMDVIKLHGGEPANFLGWGGLHQIELNLPLILLWKTRKSKGSWSISSVGL